MSRYEGKRPAAQIRRTQWRTKVDRLVAGWRQALPDVDVSPLEVLSRVSRLARHLDRQRTVVFAPHDLENVDLRRALSATAGQTRPISSRPVSCWPRLWSPQAP